MALAIAAATVALAGLSGSAALSMAFADPAPQIAARSPIAAGPAIAQLARLETVTSIDPKKVTAGELFPERLPPSSIRLARQAFSEEPLSSDALVVLALAANARGELRQAGALFEDVHRLTRRDLLASTWLAKKALEDRDMTAALDQFDEILRTTEEARADILQRFATATQDPEFSRALARLLRADPPWAAEFWQTASSVQGAAKPVGELRLELAKSGINFDPAADGALADQLVQAGEYNLAEDLYRSLAPPPDAPGERVRNAHFTHQSVLPPVDWSVTSTGDYGAEIPRNGGALVFSSVTDTRALLARQWLGLPAGRYVLRAKSVVTQEDGESGELYARLTCIGTEQFQDFALTGPNVARAFDTGICHNFWLDIIAAPSEGATDFDGSLKFISITNS
jgi:hypothetical protein